MTHAESYLQAAKEVFGQPPFFSLPISSLLRSRQPFDDDGDIVGLCSYSSVDVRE